MIPAFAVGQRVVVQVTINKCVLGTPGVVAQLAAVGAAWIELDQRSDVVGAHIFSKDHENGRWVLAYPEDCKPESPPVTAGRTIDWAAVGARFRTLREDPRNSAVTLAHLAEHAGVRLDVLERLARGEEVGAHLSMRSVVRLAVALGAQIDWFLDGREPGPAPAGEHLEGARG